MMEENLGDEDTKQWNWQALSGQVNGRWGLKTNDRDLKKIGKDGLAEYLMEKAHEAVDAVDLAEGKEFLDADWGRKSLCDWFRLKFQITVDPKELHNKTEAEVRDLLHGKLMDLYRQKEIEFPVQVGMLRFMAERTGGGAQRYDREGLYAWARERFPDVVLPPGVSEKTNGRLSEEDFRTLSRARLYELLKKASADRYPKMGHAEIDAKLAECFRGTRLAEPDDARELVEWATAELKLEVTERELTGVDQETARQKLWNAFDEKYRPEMRTMERSLLLNQVDAAWKNHLYTMDHLRSVVGLRGYAQEDPKIVYKREGMKEFETMWDALEERVTENVFRMEEAEGFQESLWNIGATIHAQAPRAIQQAAEERARETEGATNTGKEAKKLEPVRKRGERVGRNDPCPCGSGKKYKNCHMKLESGVR
jgi:preprotein translocase subunit SecA